MRIAAESPGKSRTAPTTRCSTGCSAPRSTISCRPRIRATAWSPTPRARVRRRASRWSASRCRPIRSAWSAAGSTRADAVAAQRSRRCGSSWTAIRAAAPDGDRLQGFYYHFLDMHTGTRVWRSELSMIDTALLIAGALTAAMYFTANTPAETELRGLADALYRRVDWRWAQPSGSAVDARLEARMRIPALRLGRLQRGDPALRAGAGLADASAHRRQLSRRGPRPTSGRICTATISSTRGRCSSTSSRTRGSIFAASGTASCARSAATISRTAGARPTSSANTPAQSARASPATTQTAGGSRRATARATSRRLVAGRRQAFFGYAARGVPYGPDDGTIAGSSPLSSLPFAPEIALPALRSMMARGPGDAGGIDTRQRLQSDCQRSRTARLDFGRPLRPRPGDGRADDRKLPLAD